MKVAVTSMGPDLDSDVDERFGRARYILLVDLESENLEVIDNENNAEAIQGAGIQAAQEVSERGAEWVLTGHVGPKAFQALSTASIKIGTGATGTVRDTLKRYKNGDFLAIWTADVQGGRK
ncbi:MAG: NifB/NifX family molybdenum-iron cluster-binding protein [Pseudomonadota bacterium]|jgi:predicted Fe-Mo cluster-binding NifX family protein